MKEESADIVLVEDSLDHAELVIRGLQDHRVFNPVRHFMDGEAALEYFFFCGDAKRKEAKAGAHSSRFAYSQS
jgi:hypothetical protein